MFASVIILSAVESAAFAQSSSVDVRLGPAVQARTADLGQAELDGQRLELQHEVEQAIARSHKAPLQVHLVIQDIQPNRPTSRELGLSTSLNAGSFGLGGAAITGEVVLADGSRLPIRYRFFETQLRDEVNFTTWGDADAAFNTLAEDIGAGRPPNDSRSWPPPHRPSAPTGTRLLN
ncbi:hypothetical protein [Caulobacter sp. S45]|uniref:hypothetical protein n=1 Tax=Caulobacter sp. S45 TaxID=1641861 RepID=UPI00157599F6|nr:hypothetical protein [Caulobacter sp. S45]